MVRTKKTSSFYGKKGSGKKHSHGLKMGKKRTASSYDKLYKEQLSLLSKLFHKRG